LLQKISLLKLSELKRQQCPDTPSYAFNELNHFIVFGWLMYYTKEEDE